MADCHPTVGQPQLFIAVNSVKQGRERPPYIYKAPWCEAFLVGLFSAVSHNVRFADNSGDYNEKCCTVLAWCERHGDPSIVLTECARKDRYEHSKESNNSFAVGRKRRYKVDLNIFGSCRKLCMWPA